MISAFVYNWPATTANLSIYIPEHRISRMARVQKTRGNQTQNETLVDDKHGGEHHAFLAILPMRLGWPVIPSLRKALVCSNICDVSGDYVAQGSVGKVGVKK